MFSSGQKIYRLQQVFGVHTPIQGEKYPDVTYVNRAGLDERIRYFLESGRHLVIFGPSKQGKTVLRQRAINDKDCIVIQCRTSTVKNSIYSEILGHLGTLQETGREIGNGREGSVEANLKGSAGLLELIKGEAGLGGSAKVSSELKRSMKPFGQEVENLSFVAKHIIDSGKRIILEDFHYLNEVDKKSIAGDLKTLLEYRVCVIIVATWHEQNMLGKYNGDLGGRFDEIDLVWRDEELREIIERGQTALKIQFSEAIIDEIIKDANGNVGLLQRILEWICLEKGFYDTRSNLTVIQDIESLETARKSISHQEANRYQQFGLSVYEGFPGSNESMKNIYKRIIQACIEADERELLAGIPFSLFEQRIKILDPKIRKDKLQDALSRIDRLQDEKNIYPIIASYNPLTKMFNLVDRDLLFYRKYGGPKWPWED